MINIQKLNNMPPDLPGYLVAKDKESRWIWVSNQSTLALGYQHREDLLGITLKDLKFLTDSIIEEFYKNDKTALGGNSWFGIEETFWLGQGQINLLTTKTPLYDDNNEICGSVCTCIPLITTANQKFMHNVKKSAEWVLGRSAPLNREITERDNKHHLTPRELQVLFYILHGKSSKTIANILKISSKTVEYHLSNIKIKFSVYNKEQLIEFAISEGYMKIIPMQLIQDN